MKKYIANTNVCVNIVLPSGANRHISFSPLTGGGSVFYTDDPDVQTAIESHYKFGTLFRVDQSCISENKTDFLSPQSIDSTENIEFKSDNQDEDSKFKTVVVSDPDTAKAYLADHFGISRTKIKTVKAIKDAAAANGIEFQGL